MLPLAGDSRCRLERRRCSCRSRSRKLGFRCKERGGTGGAASAGSNMLTSTDGGRLALQRVAANAGVATRGGNAASCGVGPNCTPLLAGDSEKTPGGRAQAGELVSPDGASSVGVLHALDTPRLACSSASQDAGRGLSLGSAALAARPRARLRRRLSMRASEGTRLTVGDGSTSADGTAGCVGGTGDPFLVRSRCSRVWPIVDRRRTRPSS